MRGPITRRAFLVDLGRGTLAVAVLGVACSEPELTVDQDGAWRRVNLGFVSAYVIAHNGEIAVVDTGVDGSADDIEATIDGLSMSWDDVGHVILTHAHPDHVGSLAEVLARAPGADAYIGEGDLPAVTSPRPPQVVGDGDTVMGLEVIETPGHTPGHISVLDPRLDLLVAGDALTGVDGTAGGPDPRFTDDLTQAAGSISKLAALEFEVVVFGHGEPVESDGARHVADLVATS